MPCWRDEIIEKCSGQKNHINKYLGLGSKPLQTLKVLEIKLVKKNVPFCEISDMIALGKCSLYELQIGFKKSSKEGWLHFWAAILLESHISFYSEFLIQDKLHVEQLYSTCHVASQIFHW